jgi:hypothetical protein
MLKTTLAIMLLAVASISQAATVVRFDGRDEGAVPGGARPNAEAARTAFLTAVGGSPFTLTFEGLPIGYAPTLNFTTFTFDQVGTDSTIFGGADTGVTNDTQNPTVLGYNTTPGGDTFLRFTAIFDIGTAGGKLTFNSPIEYFGAFFTGLGTAAGTLNAKFNNGTAQVLPITGGPNGGVQFFGFSTVGSPITSLDLVLDGVIGGSRDIYAIDDVITALQPTFQPTAVIPVPGAALIFGSGLLLMAAVMRRKGS